jgi:hypothetical protein
MAMQRKSPAETGQPAALEPKAMDHGKTLLCLLVLLLLFGLAQCVLPLRTAVQIGADEGFELAKATLCAHGHKLYTEIWNDQPPWHTFVVTQIIKHVSYSVLAARLVTTGFTVVLLGSLFFLIRRLAGLMVAATTVFLLRYGHPNNSLAGRGAAETVLVRWHVGGGGGGGIRPVPARNRHFEQ